MCCVQGATERTQHGGTNNADHTMTKTTVTGIITIVVVFI